MTPGRIPLNNFLLERAASNRHGLVHEAQQTVASKSDIDGIYHYGVPSSVTDPWRSAAGGVSFDETISKMAAIGEAIERSVAAIVNVPLKNIAKTEPEKTLTAEEFSLYTEEQRSEEGFPFQFLYDGSCPYTNVFDIQTNDEYWVPQPMVVLRDDYATGVPTSSGLAAGPTAEFAFIRAAQEVIERDALMITWLHSVEAKSIKVPEKYAKKVASVHGEVYIFDVTPAYSPFPVAIVAGGIKKSGVWRYSLGVACRNSWDESVEKAFLEWSQGIMFAGVYPNYVDVGSLKDKSYDSINSFDEHAVFYTVNPSEWYRMPLIAKRDELHKKPTYAGSGRTLKAQIQALKTSLKKANIRMFYRDITTIDALQAGTRVVRVLSPDMAPIFSHQSWPFLGGTVKDVQTRYNIPFDASKFPNPMPHPLG